MFSLDDFDFVTGGAIIGRLTVVVSRSSRALAVSFLACRFDSDVVRWRRARSSRSGLTGSIGLRAFDLVEDSDTVLLRR